MLQLHRGFGFWAEGVFGWDPFLFGTIEVLMLGASLHLMHLNRNPTSPKTLNPTSRQATLTKPLLRFPKEEELLSSLINALENLYKNPRKPLLKPLDLCSALPLSKPKS